jgi:hypothetical protein
MTPLLHSNADECAQEGADSGDELSTQSGALREAGLNEQGKIADLVRDFVEEDGESGRCSESW